MAEAEGKKFEFTGPDAIRADWLEVFPFKSKEQKIKVEYPEFSAVCPFSGLPDLGKIIIMYQPAGGRCIELKSLKYYFTSFRNVGLYQEGVTKRVYDDLREALGTEILQVTTAYATRGGMDTFCTEGSLSSPVQVMPAPRAKS